MILSDLLVVLDCPAYICHRLHMPADRTNGTALRIIRERSEMTVGQLVEAIREEGIDVHPDHIRNIELGYKQPSPKLLAAMARALRVPKVALLSQSDEPPTQQVPA